MSKLLNKIRNKKNNNDDNEEEEKDEFSGSDSEPEGDELDDDLMKRILPKNM